MVVFNDLHPLSVDSFFSLLLLIIGELLSNVHVTSLAHAIETFSVGIERLPDELLQAPVLCEIFLSWILLLAVVFGDDVEEIACLFRHGECAVIRIWGPKKRDGTI